MALAQIFSLLVLPFISAMIPEGERNPMEQHETARVVHSTRADTYKTRWALESQHIFSPKLRGLLNNTNNLIMQEGYSFSLLIQKQVTKFLFASTIMIKSLFILAPLIT
jgi:hypothetical protein